MDIALFNIILLVAFFVIFAIVFWLENRKEESPLYWIDMLLDKKENKLSLTKFGQFWGIAVSTWIVIFLVQRVSDDQVADVFLYTFGIWLVFLLSSSGIKLFQAIKEIKSLKKDEEKQ